MSLVSTSEPRHDRWSSQPWIRTLGVVVLAIGLGTALGGAVVLARNPLYVIGGLLGLAVGLAMIQSAQTTLLSFVGVATLLPFAVVPIPLGTFKLTAVDVTLTMLLLIWIARLLTNREERLLLSGLEGYVVVFIGLAVFSFLLGTGTTSEILRLFLKMINSVLLFFSVVNCVRTERQLSRVVAALIVGASGSAALGVVLYYIPAATTTRLLTALGPFGYPTTGVLRYIASTTTLRAISTSIDPNIYGAMLMLAAVLAASQVLAPRPVLGRGLLIALCGVIGLALLLSYSRGSWMGTLAGVLFLATLRYRRIWILVGLGVAMLALGLMPDQGGYLSHLQSGFMAQDQAAAMRLGEYKDALHLIGQYPWFGVGFGTAPDVDLYIGVSSIYLLLAEQIGLVGLASYVVAVGVLLWRAVRALFGGKLAPSVEPLLLGTTAAIIAALTAGVFDHHFVNLRFPHIVALCWLMAGLVAVSLRLGRPNEAASAGRAE